MPNAMENNIHSAIGNLMVNLNENKTLLSNLQLNKLISKTIREAMAPYGYFTPTIKISNQKTNHSWVVQASIEKNEPVIVRKVTITIHNTTPAWQRIASNFPLKKGDILTTDLYSDYKDTLFERSSNLGYFDAKLNRSRITINQKEHWADIFISFSPNTRFTNGKTTIHTNYLDTTFLERYLTYKPGDFFNSKSIQLMQNNLQNSQYFSYLEVLPNPDKKLKTVNTTIFSKTSKRFHYTFGVGYGTDTGARGTIGVQIIPINKRGHTFQIMTKLATEYSLINGTYVIPGKDPVNTQYNFFTQLNQYNLNIGSAIATQIGATYQHVFHLFKRNTLTQAIQVYQLNESSTYTGQTKQNQSMAIGSISYSIGPPATSLHADQTFQWTVSVLGAQKGLGSVMSLTQYSSTINFVKIIQDEWRLALGNEFAMTQVKKLYAVPISLQLITGGSNSIQGYDYGSIGPGKYLSTGNIILQRELYSGWFLGGFYDVGSVSDGFVKDLKQSTGPSLTKSTSIGGITFSLAKPIHDPTHNYWSFCFSWGGSL